MISVKRILLSFSGYFLFFLFVSCPEARSQAKLPAVELKSIDGEEIRLSDYTALNKILVVSFWATYCPPCLEEFSRVSNLYASWKKEVDFEFIAVSIDDNKTSGRIKGMAEAKKWPFIMLIDEMKAAKSALSYSDIPYYYITDRKGNIVFSHEGYSPGDEKTMFVELKKAAKH
jgi:peroxiredoxin